MGYATAGQLGPRRATFAILLAVGFAALAPVVSRLPWQGNGEFHTLLEVISTQLALTTGVIALVRYYACLLYTSYSLSFSMTTLITSPSERISTTRKAASIRYLVFGAASRTHTSGKR